MELAPETNARAHGLCVDDVLGRSGTRHELAVEDGGVEERVGDPDKAGPCL